MSNSADRSIIQRIFGICATNSAPDGSWSINGNIVKVDLGQLPEVSAPGSGIRIEGKELPERILLINGTDGEFHAFRNRCTHAGRRIDPHGDGLRCCSVGKSAFDLEGTVLSGSAKKNLKKYKVKRENNYIIIEV